MKELSDHCLRCGTPIENDEPGIGGICWPPGCADYFTRHLFSRRHMERAKKRDEAKLAAWLDATKRVR